MSRKQRVNQLISNELRPSFFEAVDESNKHHVPEGAETHFKLIIVSKQFNGLSKVARHRLVNKLLSKEFDSGLHALSLHLYTVSEWQGTGQTTADSPACRRGTKKPGRGTGT